LLPLPIHISHHPCRAGLQGGALRKFKLNSLRRIMNCRDSFIPTQ
jgi:hypothetical protein